MLKPIVIAAVFPLLAFSQEAAPAAQDQREYELATSASTESEPVAKLRILETWRDEYPETSLDEIRERQFLTVYQQTGRVREALSVARRLAPDFQALYAIVTLASAFGAGDSRLLDEASESARALLDGKIDARFRDKPTSVDFEAWERAQSEIRADCYRTLGWVAMQRGRHVEAERSFLTSLEENSNSAQASYWLAQVVLRQNDPSKNELAFLSFARAASLEDRGALSADSRQEVRTYLADLYRSFAGTDEGLEELFAVAAESHLPPDGWRILSKQERFAREERLRRRKFPERYNFLDLRDGLIGEDGERIWSELREKMTQPMRLWVVTAEPTARPALLRLASVRGGEVELVVQLEHRLREPVPTGVEATVEGVAQSLGRDPFVLTLQMGRIVRQ